MAKTSKSGAATGVPATTGVSAAAGADAGTGTQLDGAQSGAASGGGDQSGAGQAGGSQLDGPQLDGTQSDGAQSGASQGSGEQGAGEQSGAGPVDGASAATKPARADLDAALAQLPGDYTDADYVVQSLRSYFGELFTAEDEAAVRAVVGVEPAEDYDPEEPEKLTFPVMVVIDNGSSVPLSFPEVRQFVPAHSKSEPFEVFNADQLQRLRTDAAFTAFRNAAGDVAVILE